MRKLRRKALPKVPDSFEELEDKLWNDDNIRKMFGLSDPLPGEGEGEPFFRKGLHGPHGTTLVFASPFMVENCLKPASKAKLDATFKVMPRKPGGRQLLTIHACHGTHVSPQHCIFLSELGLCYLHLVNPCIFFPRVFLSFLLSCKAKRKLPMYSFWSTLKLNYVHSGIHQR